MTDKYDVAAIGNAIVDILAKVSDDFIKKHALEKGSMSLIDENQADELYSDMPTAIEISGGSAANTLAGVASLGGKAAFIGKVKNDDLGRIFKHDLQSIGVDYNTAPATEGPATAKCLVVVTPDAERTMSTFLGATRGITENDIDENIIAQSKVVYLEGYLWDEEHAKNAMRKAVDFARKHNKKVALSLSDPFCVDRHRDEFYELIKDGVDILFANEEEIKKLTQQDSVESAAKNISNLCQIAAITLGPKGAIILEGSKQEDISAVSNLNVVDTTGAGDLFAAGFLFALTQGKDVKTCGKFGVLSASEIIQHMGARPETNLSEYVKNAA
ncbi:adenosine kinase [Rickettsiales bacterium]|nr:adenosine kinase [Rickettsiales bacterium]